MTIPILLLQIRCHAACLEGEKNAALSELKPGMPASERARRFDDC
jgi:hypothetical protein